MKSLFAIITTLYTRKGKRNLAALSKLLLLLILIVTLYANTFQYIMALEGQSHSWMSAIYWCLVTMSTLGFGDITFTSDIGKLFSVVVLLSGTLFMLVMLPFFFIQFFFIPWMEARESSRAPKELDADTEGHVILTGLGPIEESLIKRLENIQIDYAIIVPNLQNALALNDQGYNVMVGELDDTETYIKARVDKAALVACTQADTVNTNVAFTVREVSSNVPLVATCSSAASIDILELAGCNRVLELGERLGSSFARRVLGNNGKSHVIGRFGELLLAEAVVAHPPIIGKSLSEVRFRDVVNVTIVGTWQRGKFELAGPDTVLTPSSVLVMAGSKDQFETYDKLFATQHSTPLHVIIIGAGRVGRAVARNLHKEGISYVVVDKNPEALTQEHHYLVGDAAEHDILMEAGLKRASAVVITTNDDYMNVYLTIYCRKLRNDVQLLGRANVERNVSTLHRAGADFVLSDAGINANTLFNFLKRMDTILLAEGLTAFRVSIPEELIGKSLIQCALRESTGCSIVALQTNDGLQINLDPRLPLPAKGELVIMGDTEAENRFMKRFSAHKLRKLDN